MGNSFLPTYIIRDNDSKKTGEIFSQENDFNIIFFKWVVIIIACVMMAPIVSILLFVSYFVTKFEQNYIIWFLPLAILSSVYLLIDINNHWLVWTIMTMWLEPSTISFWRTADTVVLISSIMLIPVALLVPELIAKRMDAHATEGVDLNPELTIENSMKNLKTTCYFIDAVVVIIGVLITIIFF